MLVISAKHRHLFITYDSNTLMRRIIVPPILPVSSRGAAIAFDDGEPLPALPKAMLNVLMHKGIGEIVAVVVRYYGGIQLGAGGGLVRCL